MRKSALTGLSRDLLYAEMRRGHLTSVKVGWRGLIKNGARVLGHDEIEQLKAEVLGWKQLERDALWRKVSDVPAEELETPPSFSDNEVAASAT